jgi:acyl transferase domain-containing protein
MACHLHAAGDPIEVGAAAEVLVPSLTMPGLDRLPLALASSKSFLGHSEPAAGIVGMLHAAHMLRQAALPPIAHLVQLNPYVEAAVAGSRGHWSMPRQSAGLVGLAAAAGMSQQQAQRSVGTSAFAFQGKPLCCLASNTQIGYKTLQFGGCLAWGHFCCVDVFQQD